MNMKKIKRLLSGITAAALAISLFSGLPQGVFSQYGKDTAGFTVSAEDSADSSYCELYRDKLLEIIEEDDNYSEEYAFDLYDLDSDGIPELFLSSGTFHIGGVNVYSVYNNEVQDIGNEYYYGSFGVVEVSQNNFLKDTIMQMGYEAISVYQKKYNSLECLIFAENNSLVIDAEQYCYSINNVEVPKEEYDKALSEYNSFKWETVGRKYTLDESTVNSVLGTLGASETSGKCGDDAYWELSEDGVLTISGSGDMYDYLLYQADDTQRSPWYNQNTKIKNIIIGEGITRVGSSVFAGCELVDFIYFPSSVTEISINSMLNCNNLKICVINNSNVELANSMLGYISNTVSQNDRKIIDGFTIYGRSGSTAEKYAEDNSIAFYNTYFAGDQFGTDGIIINTANVFIEDGVNRDFYFVKLDKAINYYNEFSNIIIMGGHSEPIVNTDMIGLDVYGEDLTYCSENIGKMVNVSGRFFTSSEGVDCDKPWLSECNITFPTSSVSSVNASLTCDEIVYNMGNYSRNSYNALFTIGNRTSGSIAPSDGGKNEIFSRNEITYDLTDVEVTYKISGGFSFSDDGKTNTIVSSTIPGKIRSNTVYTEELTIFPIGEPSDTLLITALITGNGGYSNSVTLNETVHKQFTAKYRGQETKTDKSLSFDYSDRLFDKPASEFDQKLVQASLALELSSWTSYGTDNWTSEGNFDRDRNLVALLHSLGFVDYESQKYDVALSNSDDSAAFGIARKEITGADGKKTNLVAVAVRGGGYGAEWASNFNVGDNGKYAEGFYNASTGVYNYIKDYIGRYGLGKDTKIWITGFSRAAATANLTAARLGNDFSNENIYAYTFATPQGYVFEWADSVNLLNKDYHNIHNIINPADLVPTVVFSGWGFIRFGESHIINYSDNAAMKEIYTQQMNGKEYAFNVSNPDTVREIDDLVVNVLASNTKEYKKLYQDAIFRIMQESNSQRDMFENGWQDAIVAILSDNRIKLSLEASKIKIDIPDLTDIKTPNDIIKDTCPIYITYKFFYDTVSEKIIKEISNKYDIMGILNQHYPEVYIGWVFSSDSTSLYSDMSYKTAIIDCPVDVYVYNSSGDLVASIINDEIVDEQINTAVFGDQKRIYLHDDTYSIKLVGNDTGTMDYSIEEYDSTGYIIRRTAVYDVPLEKGTTYSGQINEEIDSPAENYSLTNGNENYSPVFDSNNSSAKIYSVSVEGGVSTKPFAYPGEKVTVTALASGENSEFVKWSGNVGSENADAPMFTFTMPESDVELIAHTQESSDNQTAMSDHIIKKPYIFYISVIICLFVIIFAFVVIKHKKK